MVGACRRVRSALGGAAEWIVKWSILHESILYARHTVLSMEHRGLCFFLLAANCYGFAEVDGSSKQKNWPTVLRLAGNP